MTKITASTTTTRQRNLVSNKNGQYVAVRLLLYSVRNNVSIKASYYLLVIRRISLKSRYCACIPTNLVHTWLYKGEKV